MTEQNWLGDQHARGGSMVTQQPQCRCGQGVIALATSTLVPGTLLHTNLCTSFVQTSASITLLMKQLLWIKILLHPPPLTVSSTKPSKELVFCPKQWEVQSQKADIKYRNSKMMMLLHGGKSNQCLLFRNINR